MTAHDDLDRQLDAFLRDGPSELPDASYYAVRDRTEATRQRAGIGSWRLPDMNKILAIGLGTAAVVVALILGTQLIGPAPSGVGAPASPTPSLSPSPRVGHTLNAGGGGGVPISVVIPAAGWADMADVSAVIKGEEVDNVPEAALLGWSWPAGTDFYIPNDPCHWESTMPTSPATTVDEIVAALAAQATRAASAPTDVTLDGHAGKRLTLHVPSDLPSVDGEFTSCDQSTFASYSTNPSAGADGLDRTHQGPGQIDELWILDVDGSMVILDAMSRPDTGAALLDEMHAIVESAAFEAS